MILTVHNELNHDLVISDTAIFVSIEEIKEMPPKQAYLNLLLQTHPDKNSGCPKTAEWKFNLVQKVAKTKGFKASV